MKQVNLIGTKYVNRFINNDTGEIFDEVTNKAYYESLAQPNPVNPTMEGYTWKVSFSDNLYDTQDGNIGDNEYAAVSMYLFKIPGQGVQMSNVDPNISTAPMQVNAQ